MAYFKYPTAQTEVCLETAAGRARVWHLCFFPLYYFYITEPFHAEGLPGEIIMSEELQTNGEGKQYAYAKDDIFCGGDYLPESPAEIDLNENDDFPSSPEINHVL